MLVAVLTCLLSCSKEELNQNDSQNQKLNSTISPRSTPVISEFTVIDSLVEYPFTVQRMTDIYNVLNATPVTKLATTHLYVKFEPQTRQAERKLLELDDIYLSDYPFEAIVSQVGYHYQDPSLPAIKHYYAIVPINYDFKNVPYTKVHDLHIDLTEGNMMNIAIGEVHGLVVEPCFENDPGWPECQCDGYPVNSQAYKRCLELLEFGFEGDRDPPPPPVNSACACTRPSNDKRPSGCVTVVETHLGLDGVSNVQVQGSSLYGLYQFSTSTDDNGCWTAPYSLWYPKGQVDIKVRFKNSKSTIRALRIVDVNGTPVPLFWSYGQIVEDKSWSIYPHNDHYIEYNNDASLLSVASMHYFAATVNNSVQEYHQYANQLGITKPTTDFLLSDELDILLSPFDGGGAAPMIDEIGSGPFGQLYIDFAALSVIQALYRVVENISVPSAVLDQSVWDEVTIPLLLTYVNLYAPDIVYNYGNAADPIRNTEIYKSTLYHELAHAAHYESLPSSTRKLHWVNNIRYITTNVEADLQDDLELNNSVENPPYGTGALPGSERCAIIESWAEYVSRIMITQRYVGFPLPPELILLGLETLNPIPAASGGASNDLWMPFGLYLDLSDSPSDYPSSVIDPITESVSGYSLQILEQGVINNTPTNIATVEAFYLQNIPSGNVSSDISTLFNDYGF